MKIEKDKNLKAFTTFKIGGNAQFFCSVRNEEELSKAVAFAGANRLKIFILGGGSNILVSDRGVTGLVIKMEMHGVELTEEGSENVRVTAAAGEEWDALVSRTVDDGLYGLENLSFIPGTVGAAPVQNIGAYGSEIRDTVDVVRVYDIEEESFKAFSNFDCKFEYRSSIFKRQPGRHIITSVSLLLKKNGSVNTSYGDVREYFRTAGVEKPTLAEVRKAVILIRERKLPDVRKVGTAGSFFKNPLIEIGTADDLKARFPGLPVYPVNENIVKVSLAWIIDKVCGYKGAVHGNVGTYKNQALVLVNNKNASAEEILFFAEEIKKIIKEKTGIDAEYEVQLVGF